MMVKTTVRLLREYIRIALTEETTPGNKAYGDALKAPGSPKPFEDQVIASGEPKWMFFFALNIPEANISRLENGVIASKRAEWIIRFAEEVKGANIPRLEQAIIDVGLPRDIYAFARDIWWQADLPKLQKAIQKSKSKEWQELFNQSFGTRLKYDDEHRKHA